MNFIFLLVFFFSLNYFFWRKYNQEFAQLVLLGSTIECKLWEKSATLVTSINSVKMLYPFNKKVVLHMKRVCTFSISDLSLSFGIAFFIDVHTGYHFSFIAFIIYVHVSCHCWSSYWISDLAIMRLGIHCWVVKHYCEPTRHAVFLL